jgi:hypothetical protein
VNNPEPDPLRARECRRPGAGRTAGGRGKAQKGKKGTLWLCRKRAAMRRSSDQWQCPIIGLMFELRSDPRLNPNPPRNLAFGPVACWLALVICQ